MMGDIWIIKLHKQEVVGPLINTVHRRYIATFNTVRRQYSGTFKLATKLKLIKSST